MNLDGTIFTDEFGLNITGQIGLDDDYIAQHGEWKNVPEVQTRSSTVTIKKDGAEIYRKEEVGFTAAWFYEELEDVTDGDSLQFFVNDDLVANGKAADNQFTWKAV
ncbi:MAG: hypothetical protein P8P30_02720 [Rickettsiales bacterium]|nr:hypothetical protein [Rickettsiales bacterium]